MNAAAKGSGFVERWYLPVALSLWFLMPEIRRLIDWQVGPNSISIVSVIPLTFLVPLALPVVRGVASQHLVLPFRVLSYAWLAGFAYAFVVAFAAGGRLDAIFQLLQFCLPFVAGAWVVVRPTSRAQSFKQITATFLWVGAFVGAYGIYQYVAPPPWDIAWVNFSGLNSIGVAEPFGLRVFSTLNSPGTAAFFFVFVVLIGLHALDLRRPMPIFAVTICVAALALTNVRAAWVALALGVVAFLAFSPRRGRPLAAVAVVAAVMTLLVFNASTLLGYQDVTMQLIARLNTLSDVDSDYSANDRARETADAMHKALEEPLGQGLGTVGTSTKLGGGGQLTLDNGYMSRFVEMGVAGFAAYLVTLGCGIIFALGVLRRAIEREKIGMQQIAATALAVQVAMLGLDLSVDSHAGLAGLVFWLLLGMTLRREVGDPAGALRAFAPVAAPAASQWA